jgi:hypothetical protein
VAELPSSVSDLPGQKDYYERERFAFAVLFSEFIYSRKGLYVFTYL